MTNTIYTLIQIVFFGIFFALLVYTTVNVKYIINNLNISCTGQDFDPTKKYTASFVFPEFLQSKVKSINGTITGTKTNNTSGTFSITFNSVSPTGTTTDVFQGQKYSYSKSTCNLNYSLTDDVKNYLTEYKIDLAPYIADLLPNNSLRLTGNYVGLGFSIPLSVIAYS